MSPNEIIRETAEMLLMDYYKRTVKESGIFFGLDTGHYCTELEDLRKDKNWKNHYCIGFRIAYGQSAETMTNYIGHEPRFFDRVLGAKTTNHWESYPDRPNAGLDVIYITALLAEHQGTSLRIQYQADGIYENTKE